MGNEIDIKSILGLVRRQIWIIVSVVIGILALTVLATLSLTPSYTATAKVLVDPSYKDLLRPATDAQYSNTDNFKVDSEVALIATDNVMLQVIQEYGLVNDSEFGVSFKPANDLLTRLGLRRSTPMTGSRALALVLGNVNKSVDVAREGLTYLISVSVTSQDPAKAAKLTNAVVDAYIQQQIQSKISQVVAGRRSLQTRADEANSALVASERQFDQFLTENLDRIEKETGSTDISRLRAELERIQKERNEQSGAIQLAELSMKSGDYSAIIGALQDEAFAQLESRRAKLSSQLALSAENSADALDLRAELQKVEKSLKNRAAAEVNSIKKEIATAEKNAGDVRQQLRTSILASNLPPEVLTNIYSMQQTSEIARTQYQNMLARIQELDAQATLQVPDSRVVSAALVPAIPSFPDKRIILIAAFVVALGLGFGFAILREHFIGGFVSDEQIESVLRVPLASVMPRQLAGEVTHSIADLTLTAPLSMFSEGVRRIRVKIEQMLFKRNGGKALETRDGITILVSSTEPGEGKSTVSLALARTLSASGKKVVLIDCDLRKPTIHKLLGLEASTELVELLRGNEIPQLFTKITMKDPMSNLTAIVGGRVGDQATDELLMGDRISRLLAAAKKHFDYVVIDTPPVDPVVDSLYLARHADVIAFIVRWASTSQSLAKKSIAALVENAQPGTPVVAVLNQKEQAKIAGYYRYSGYYTK
ncbi:GumC family protein [Rhizobium sp. LjRoot254]|uniref:GumC family protein n=1 Tax=Rhizobium sp. LjRoot254 TaxID=3342297 RepID=UPI003ED006E2